MSDSPSRREMTRVPLQIETELRAEGHPVTLGKTTDISLKGLHVTSQRSLPAGATCHVTLRLGPQEHPVRIDIEGTVVRTTDEGMAIEINSVSPDSFSHLHNLVIYNAQDTHRIDEELHNRVSRRWHQAAHKEQEEKS
jgi:PilZ domain-containing protein